MNAKLILMIGVVALERLWKNVVRFFQETPAERYIEKPAQRIQKQAAGRFQKTPAERYVKEPAQRIIHKVESRFQKTPTERYIKEPAQRILHRVEGRFRKSPTERYIQEPMTKLQKRVSRRFRKSPTERYIKEPLQRTSAAISKRVEDLAPRPRARSRWLILGLGSLLGAAVGYMGYKAYPTVRKMVAQPRHVSRAVLSRLSKSSPAEVQAVSTAVQKLRSGIVRRHLPDGREVSLLTPGSPYYNEPWSRHFGYSSFGLMALEDFRVTRDTLEVFLLNQKTDGQLPIQLRSAGDVEAVLHAEFNPEHYVLVPVRPKYETDKGEVYLDGTALLVIAALSYAEQTYDHAFVQIHWPALKLAMDWLSQRPTAGDSLLDQANGIDWDGTAGKSGPNLYTNVVYWKALVEMANAAGRYGTDEEARTYRERAGAVEKSINQRFWREDMGFFLAREDSDDFSTAGNLMAAAWGLATPDQGRYILNKIDVYGLADPIPTQAIHNLHPVEYVDLERQLGGLANYQTDAAWLWLGGWHVIALVNHGRFQKAEELFSKITRTINHDRAVYEVYGPDRKPVPETWTTSAAPPSAAPGMVIYAWDVLTKERARQKDLGKRKVTEKSTLEQVVETVREELPV